jgi:predicted dithiol-disulfide oxidoreductase (DUF899 family)
MKTKRKVPQAESHLPPVVTLVEWQRARAVLLKKEKAATRARDALAAERRRLPMVRVETDYVFDGEDGPARLVNLFEGRSQLLLYHFMFAPGVQGWPTAGCPGCSMFADNIGQFTTVHLNARNASLALVSLAPLDTIQAYRRRMSWPHRWVSSAKNTFNVDFGLTTAEGEQHGLSVLVRDGAEVYRTYFSTARGCESLGNIWGFLDVTPYGRQEQWEDSPPGWPRTPPFQWWRRHDEYGREPPAS